MKKTVNFDLPSVRAEAGAEAVVGAVAGVPSNPDSNPVPALVVVPGVPE